VPRLLRAALALAAERAARRRGKLRKAWHDAWEGHSESRKCDDAHSYDDHGSRNVATRRHAHRMGLDGRGRWRTGP
jgi:hypothetical protein